MITRTLRDLPCLISSSQAILKLSQSARGHFVTLMGGGVHLITCNPGARFSKVPKTFRAGKVIVKLRPAYSVRLVFSYVVKEIKIKITAKICASRHLRFEDTKRIVSPEMRPKSFGTFEKRAPGHIWSFIFYSKYRRF